jgi:hypothetical protein
MGHRSSEYDTHRTFGNDTANFPSLSAIVLAHATNPPSARDDGKRVSVLTSIRSSSWYVTHQYKPSVQHDQTHCEMEMRVTGNVVREHAVETALARPRMT